MNYHCSIFVYYVCIIHDSMATIEEGITTVLFLSITYVYT